MKVFENNQFGAVRTLEENGKVLFCGSDVAKALGYTNPNKAINDHCRAITKRSTPVSGKIQEINFIPEGDIYRLVAHSKLPTAERFEKWVFDEVLPTIRKTGGYVFDEQMFVDTYLPNVDAQIKQLFSATLQTVRQLNTKIEQDKPKVVFANAVETANTTILIGELAKILKQNGVSIGQNRLFEWLRSNGYLVKRRGSDYNAPTQRAMEMRLFEVKERVIERSDGTIIICKTTKVTGKGQQYFINKLLSEAA